jgi:hypothetical protein
MPYRRALIRFIFESCDSLRDGQLPQGIEQPVQDRLQLGRDYTPAPFLCRISLISA